MRDMHALEFVNERVLERYDENMLTRCEFNQCSPHPSYIDVLTYQTCRDLFR
jgi:hypothetical protein